MPDIRLEHLTCRFGATVAVNDITTVFAEGSVTCLLGPSGCGKTTLLRMIAGLERPTAGRVFFGERDVTHLRARRRDVAMVFQYPVMYRTLSVVENVELPLRSDRSLSAADRRARVEQVLGVLQLEAALIDAARCIDGEHELHIDGLGRGGPLALPQDGEKRERGDNRPSGRAPACRGKDDARPSHVRLPCSMPIHAPVSRSRRRP